MIQYIRDFQELHKYQSLSSPGCFQKLGYPKMDGENNGNPYSKWMIWGYHHFWKHPSSFHVFVHVSLLIAILSHMFWYNMHTHNNVYMYILSLPFFEQPNFAQWEQGILHIDHPLETSRECIRFMPQPGPSPTRPNHRAASLQTVNLPVWHLGGCIRAWIQMVGRIFMRWMRHAESDEQSKRG